MKNVMNGIFFVTVATMWSCFAQATVITFDALEAPTGGITPVASPYLENGFQLTGAALSTFSQDNSRYAGSAGLANGASSAVTTLSAVGGATFVLNSIDLSFIEPNGSSDAVLFEGLLFGGGTVSQEFTPTQFGFTIFSFDASFVNLLSVSWAQTSGSSSTGHQFDNIVVNGTIPTPTTILLFGLGLAGLGWSRRKKA